MIWIEDTVGLKKKYPPCNLQDCVLSWWKELSKMDGATLEKYLRLLPETHQAMWQALAG
jgi:hypothetical protein